MPGIVPLVLTITEDQLQIVHVKLDISILVLLNVLLVTANVYLVLPLLTNVLNVKPLEFLDLNHLVIVKATNTLILALVPTVLSDV
jgi:hypothetical protein